MSARKTLDDYIETLQILARDGDADRTDEERERDAAHRAKLIDGHAHELAEKLWAEGASWGEQSAAGKAYRAAGDLIDPRVNSGALALVDDGRCHATLQGWPDENLEECVREAGHYDLARKPDYSGDEPDPGGWHQSEPGPDGTRTTWADWANGATPHGAGPVRPDEEPT